MTGYLDAGYADSLSEFGRPRPLVGCGGWILERSIPGSTAHDAMGCYPLFVCRKWSRLPSDLESLRSDLVSLSLVSDPFGEYDVEDLRRCFDVVIPFKEHIAVDLRHGLGGGISEHHRYCARRSLRDVSVEVVGNPPDWLPAWMELYTNLRKRHRIDGLRAFSEAAFEKQLRIPGVVMLRAVAHGLTVAAHIWYAQGEIGYSHLQASNAEGYRLMAAYALLQSAIEHFAGRLSWLDLGGVPGVASGDGGGLRSFKAGWSRETRRAHFCGRIFDASMYGHLVARLGTGLSLYFPAYRDGEFS